MGDGRLMKVSVMRDIWSIVRPLVDTCLAEARAEGHPADTVGRALLSMAIDIYRRERSIEDIRSELEAAIENLDPDEDHTFMRP